MVTVCHCVGYLETARRSRLLQRRPAATGSLWWHRGDTGHPSSMPSTRPFVCPRAKLRSLPRGSPALGLGTFSAKARAGHSGDLMDFYATTYAVAYGHPGFRPFLGHHVGAGFVSNTRSDAAGLVRPRSAAGGPFWDTATAERFQPLLLPDGRSLLPRHVHQPGSGYGREQPFPHLRAGAVSPPPASGEHGADPAQTDVLQRTTIGAKEETGFTRATPTSGIILPATLGQPLGASTTTTDYLPPPSGTGSRAIPVLARGSDRGSGFSRETPRGPLSVPASPRRPPVLLASRGLQAPDLAQARLRGQQSTGRMEPSGFTTNNSWAATPPWTPCPAAPAEPGPGCTARPWGGVQAPRPSGFGTNNLRTALGGGGGTGFTAPSL